MNTDKHRFYIRKRRKDKRPNGTRMNTDEALRTNTVFRISFSPYDLRLTVVNAAHGSVPSSSLESAARPGSAGRTRSALQGATAGKGGHHPLGLRRPALGAGDLLPPIRNPMNHLKFMSALGTLVFVNGHPENLPSKDGELRVGSGEL